MRKRGQESNPTAVIIWRITENQWIILSGLGIRLNNVEKGTLSPGDLGYHLVTREIAIPVIRIFKGVTDHETRCSHFRSFCRYRRRCRCLCFLLSNACRTQPPIRDRGPADSHLRPRHARLCASCQQRPVIRSGNRTKVLTRMLLFCLSGKGNRRYPECSDGMVKDPLCL